MKTESEFNKEKAQKINDVKIRIEMLESGIMLEILQMELMLTERQTYVESTQDRRFLVN
jgi:hypothetical protein